MAQTPHKILLSGLAALASTALLTVATGTVATDKAEAANASSCGVTLTPATRTVRRGGKVLLNGETCSAGASSAGPSAVQVKIQNKKRWTVVGKDQTDSDGDFSVCAKVTVPSNTKVARIRATASGSTGTTTVRVSKKGSSGCKAGGSPDTGLHKPPAPDNGNPNCPLTQPGSTVGMTVSTACTTVWQDNGNLTNPNSLWGVTDCENASRHQVVGSDGSTAPTGTGGSQGNNSFRRMTVMDGDDVYGERCELGFNNWSGPTALYDEGQRRLTYISLRLPNNSDINDSKWRTVMQMKQAQGYRNPDNSPIFEMQVRDGEWHIGSSWQGLWDAPAQQNKWTRFAFDIKYSQDPSIGTIKVYVDLNGDGDADDANEQSPVIHTATLRAETAGTGYSDYAVGESIPDHLRAGIYQDPSYDCPSGCSVDVDNVQVIKP